MSYRGFHDRPSLHHRIVMGPAAVPWLMAAAAAMQAVSSIQQGEAAREAADYQAAQAENDAVAARQQAAFDESREREKALRVMASQRARAAKGGVLAEQGSPLFVNLARGEDAEIDALNIRRGGELRGNDLRSQAALARRKGAVGEQAAYLKAGSSLLQAGASFGKSS